MCTTDLMFLQLMKVLYCAVRLYFGLGVHTWNNSEVKIQDRRIWNWTNPQNLCFFLESESHYFEIKARFEFNRWVQSRIVIIKGKFEFKYTINFFLNLNLESCFLKVWMNFDGAQREPNRHITGGYNFFLLEGKYLVRIGHITYNREHDTLAPYKYSSHFTHAHFWVRKVTSKHLSTYTTLPFPPDSCYLSSAPCQTIIRQLSDVSQMSHQTPVNSHQKSVRQNWVKHYRSWQMSGETSGRHLAIFWWLSDREHHTNSNCLAETVV